MKVITASKRHCLWVMNARVLLVHQGVIYNFKITSNRDTCMHSSVSTCMHEFISNRSAVATCEHFQDMFIISDQEGQYHVLIKHPVVLYECSNEGVRELLKLLLLMNVQCWFIDRDISYHRGMSVIQRTGQKQKSAFVICTLHWSSEGHVL